MPLTGLAFLAAGGLQWPDYAVIVGYFLAMILIGVYFSRQKKTGEDYFLAGRSMPWLAVGLSLFSALLSTISYLAVPGETIHQGLAYCLSLLHIPFSYGVIYFVLIPFFMRLRVVSAYEYLERRFSRPVRLLGAGLFMLYCLGWMAAVVVTCSVGLHQMTGWPLWLILVCNGLVSTLYTTMGGMRAVIWTDVSQAVLMLAGGVLTLIFVGMATSTTPVDWWNDAGQAGMGHTDPLWFTFDPQVRSSVFWITLNMFAWMICTHGGNQVALQRYFTMSAPRQARRMLLIKMAAEIFMTLLLVATGFALLSFYYRKPELLPEGWVLTQKPDSDNIFPRFIAFELPTVFAGGVVAALFAAAMSTISSGVNSMAAVFAIDIMGTRQKSSDSEQARQGLWFTAISGILITAVAWGLLQLPKSYNFIDLMQMAFNFLLGGLGGLFFIGMFLPQCTSRSAVPATLIGLGIGFLLAYWKLLFGSDFSPYWVIACSCAATVASGALLGMLEPAQGLTKPLVWGVVVGGEAPPQPVLTPAEGRDRDERITTR